MSVSLKGEASPGEAPREAGDAAPQTPVARDAARPAAAASPPPELPPIGPRSWARPAAGGSAPELPEVAFTTGAWRDRIGWWRSLILCVVVMVAAAAVIIPSAAVLRHYQQVDASKADATSEQALAAHDADADADARADEQAGDQRTGGPAAPSTPPPAVPTTAPPSAAPVPAAPAASPAPTKAAGRAAAGSLNLAFVVDTAELHAGAPTTVSVSATGDGEDHVAAVRITTADGTVLSSGNANGCEGPPLPWTQSFPVVFAAAQSTQLQVALTSCKGGSLVALALVDIQP